MKQKSFMKHFLLLVFVLLFLPARYRAQEISQGVVTYTHLHNWVKKMAAIDYISKQQKERIAYMWSNDAEWKAIAKLYFTPTQSFYEDSDEKANDDESTYSWKKDIYSIRRDFANNKTLDMIKMSGKVYIIEDSIKAQGWKLMNDLKEVAGHVCMNARWIDTIKHQSIIAWFALDIPISAGPERFCGLPGMILEVDINDGGLIITADKIEVLPVEQMMTLPKKMKGKRISEAAYESLLNDFMKERRKAEEPYFWGVRY